MSHYIPDLCDRPLMAERTGMANPPCLMPRGHRGGCETDAQDALIRLHCLYDDSGGSMEAWDRLNSHKQALRDAGYAADVERYEERLDEAAAARGYW